MAAACGITLVKKFTYRGDANEEWSNTYWFDGTAPATQSEADSMARALAAKEVTVFLGTSQIVRAYVYDDDSPTAVAAFTVDLTTGSGSPYAGRKKTGTGKHPAGDQAGGGGCGGDEGRDAEQPRARRSTCASTFTPCRPTRTARARLTTSPPRGRR